ncbi:unnamed protein product [Lactuca saligna]|uniref:Uncharacterized protein n=1 Tax=Lactuca saligna TaxID=75948 RepID=A0AA35UL85_LACSI|nr:unnamed protein product [Lactuca saligna]
MNTTDFNKSLMFVINFIREIADLLEVAHARLHESYVLDERVQLYMANNVDDLDVQALHNTFEKAVIDDQSMQDNISFMLGSIHKRIRKYKRNMKDTPAL